MLVVDLTQHKRIVKVFFGMHRDSFSDTEVTWAEPVKAYCAWVGSSSFHVEGLVRQRQEVKAAD